MSECVKIPRNDAIHMFVVVGFRTAGQWTNEKLNKTLAEFEDIADGETPLDDDRATATRATVLTALHGGTAIEVDGDDPVSNPVDAKAAEKASKSAAKSAEKDAAKAAEKATKEAAKAAEKAAKEAEKAAAKAAKSAEKDAAKAAKEAEKAAAKAAAADATPPSAEGATTPATEKSGTSMMALIGQLVAKHGLQGNLEVMVGEYTAERGEGRDNAYHFKVGWHAIRGYTGAALQDRNTRSYLGGIVLREKGIDSDEAALIAELDERFGRANPSTSKSILRNGRHAIEAYLAAGGDPSPTIVEPVDPTEAPADAPTEAEAAGVD